MSSLTTSFSSPGSLQVRSIRRGHESPSFFLHIRFRVSRPRILILSASLGDASGGREGQSWSISNSSPDPFSGWSGMESEEGGNSQGKGGRGGMLGAGLAGILFLGGVTFATLSLRSKTSRITSGAEHKMKPLTTEQEVLLTFDDQSAETDKDGNGTTAISDDKESKIDNHYPDSVTAFKAPPGKVVVPAVIDQVQSQALAALQVLKVIEPSVQPGDLCTRREYARWLVSASSALSRNAASKLYPAMFIENITELAFDDVTAEDPDFSSIQGLAEAGIIYSKLSLSDTGNSSAQSQDSLLFSPESPLSRQDLVSWKMVLERKRLPEVDRNLLYQISGFIDIDKIDPGAWPALLSDISSGDQSIISLAFGYTRLFQPNKPVTKSQAAIALATGEAAEIVGEELARIEAESLAETAVNAHTALVAQVEKDLNASFEQELAKEREKIDVLEKLAEEARQELERIRAEREEENDALLKGKVAVKSELELLSTLKCQVEQQIQELMGSNVEVSFERERITKLREEIESGNQSVVRLQYELEVERKALSMARTWAEEEAKRARELARALEEARERWTKHGIKVVVDEDLQEDSLAGITWVTAGKQTAADETIIRGESLVEKLKAMASEIRHKSSITIKSIIDKIAGVISALKQKASESSTHARALRGKIVLNAGRSVENIKGSASAVGSNVVLRARKAIDDCKENVEKMSEKFKA